MLKGKRSRGEPRIFVRALSIVMKYTVSAFERIFVNALNALDVLESRGTETNNANPTVFVATTKMFFAIGYMDADGNLVTLEERKLAYDGKGIVEREIASADFSAYVAPLTSVPDEN